MSQRDVSVSRYHRAHGHVEMREDRNENTVVQSEQTCAGELTRPPQLVFIQRKNKEQIQMKSNTSFLSCDDHSELQKYPIIHHSHSF